MTNCGREPSFAPPRLAIFEDTEPHFAVCSMTVLRELSVYILQYSTHVAYEVEVSDEFRNWYEPLNEAEHDSISRIVGLLQQQGPSLPYPYSSGIQGSRIGHLRELRIQHQGRPYRVLYAFDPRRAAYLLLGGDKTGDSRWYEVNVPEAESIYSAYLKELRNEQQL